MNPAFGAALSIAVGTFIGPINVSVLNLTGAVEATVSAMVTGAVASTTTSLIEAALAGNFDLDDIVTDAAFAAATRGLTDSIDIPDSWQVSNTSLIAGVENGKLTIANILNQGL